MGTEVKLCHVSHIPGAEGVPGDVVTVSDEQAKLWLTGKRRPRAVEADVTVRIRPASKTNKDVKMERD